MKHSEIAQKDTWDLEAMFPTPADWEKEYALAEERLGEAAAYYGKLAQKENLLSCLRLLDELNLSLEILYVYASCRKDENQSDEEANLRYSRIYNLLSRSEETLAFVEPQLAALSEETLRALIADPDFADYDYMLERTIRGKPYVLSENEERILALAGNFTGVFGDVFSMLENVDLDFPTVSVDGRDVKLTHGQYSFLLQDARQSVRKLAFDAYYAAFEQLKNTLTANYYGNVKKDIFYAKARGYASFLDKAMLSEDVPAAVYPKLLSKINGSLDAMHDYIALRKDMLGLDKIHMYDLYTSIAEGSDLSVGFDEAERLVREALAPLGEEYVAHIADAFRERWIDVYEADGKRSGGYCTHAYRAPHPYVLLNYSRTTHDVFTLAHELGHAMHSFYSARVQPPAKADYKIFVAEVASTTNEMLLLAYLLKTTTDPKFKKFLLAYRLDTIRTTIYRQTMFAEFEYETHRKVEADEPLSVEGLSDLYAGLNRKYYGELIEADPHIRYEWLRIPHFYYNFYVYKYATGLTAAIALSERILAGDGDIKNEYARFLSAGGSKSPYEILKDCGVDLADDAPYDRVAELFRETLADLRRLNDTEAK